MASCRSTSFYLSPGVYRKFNQYVLAAVLPTGETVEIKHRKMVKELLVENPLWDGLVLCVNRSLLGKSSIAEFFINKPASVERWIVDWRIIEGRRPVGVAYELHRLAHHGVEAIGGLLQVRSGLLGSFDPVVRRAATKLIERGGRGAAYRISVALAAQGFLDPHTIANLLRVETPYEYATFAPIHIEKTRAAFAVMQSRYPNDYKACITKMLDGSTLGEKWLDEYLTARYAVAGLGPIEEHPEDAYTGKRAWIELSYLYGFGENFGRNTPTRQRMANQRGMYPLLAEDEHAARGRLVEYVANLHAGSSNLPEKATILRMLREKNFAIPYSALLDPRLMADPETAHGLIMGVLERAEYVGTGDVLFGNLYKDYSPLTGYETRLYGAVSRHTFGEAGIDALLNELGNQKAGQKRRLLGGILKTALNNSSLTPDEMERVYTRLLALGVKPCSAEAQLVGVLLARRDLPVAIGEAHVRSAMEALAGAFPRVLGEQVGEDGVRMETVDGGIRMINGSMHLDAYSDLGTMFTNPHLLASSPYIREQARTFLREGTDTVRSLGNRGHDYATGHDVNKHAEVVLIDVARKLLDCSFGTEEERGLAMKTYINSVYGGVVCNNRAVLDHFTTYQPSKQCDTLQELWWDYCSTYGAELGVEPDRSPNEQLLYESIAVNPNVGPKLQKLAYEKTIKVERSAYVGDVEGRFLGRVAGSRGVDPELREAAAEKYLNTVSDWEWQFEEDGEYRGGAAWDPRSWTYPGLALAGQIIGDSSSTENMLALVMAQLETKATQLTKYLANNTSAVALRRSMVGTTSGAAEIDLLLHMVDGRSLTGAAAVARRSCEKARADLHKMLADKTIVMRDEESLHVYNDEHRHQASLATGRVLASRDERQLDEMLTLDDRERISSTSPDGAEACAWPERISSVSNLPGYGHLPFSGTRKFSEQVDGDDYRFPETQDGGAKLSRVAVISSGGELRQNAKYMGNCTGGYAHSISEEKIRIVAVYDTDGACVLNLSFERRASNAACPETYRPLVLQILERLNRDGDGWGLCEINTRFNGLGNYGQIGGGEW